MKEYSYVAPASVGECLQILQQAERIARITAGCTNLLPNLKSNKITVQVAGIHADIRNP